MSKQDYYELISKLRTSRLSQNDKLNVVINAFKEKNYKEGYFQYEDQKESLILQIISIGRIANDLLIQLIDEGINHEIKDLYEETTIVHALAKHRLLKALEHLLRKEPWIVNQKDKFGKTAFLYSFSIEAMGLLLQYGEDINVTDNSGRTALHKACNSRDKSIVEWLLEHGANPNLPDMNGETPLMTSRATWGFRKNIVNNGEIDKILIIHGADLFQENKYGQIAFDIQRDEGRKRQLCAAMYVWKELMGKQLEGSALDYHTQLSLSQPVYIEVIEFFREHWKNFHTRIIDKISRGIQLDKLEKEFVNSPNNYIVYQGILAFLGNHVGLLNEVSLFPPSLPDDIVRNIIQFLPNEDTMTLVQSLHLHLKDVGTHLRLLSKCRAKSSISGYGDEESKAGYFLEEIPHDLMKDKRIVTSYINNLKRIKPVFEYTSHIDNLYLVALNKVLGMSVRIDYGNNKAYTILGNKEKALISFNYTGSQYSFSGIGNTDLSFVGRLTTNQSGMVQSLSI